MHIANCRSINRFEKKAGRKMNYDNQQSARFDRRKVRCYKCLQLGHFARECNVKTVDDKARYSAFKVTEVKTDEPKALVSVDSMVNWSDHAAENKTGEVEKVYGMMAGHGGAGVSDAAAEFAMMGISPKVQNCPLGCDSKINDLNNMYNNLDRLYNDCYIKVQAYQNAVKTLESQKDWYHKTQIALEEKIRVLSANLENTTNTLSYTEKLHDQAQKEKKEWEVKYEATLARFEKWKESSKNLNKLINSSMSTRTKIGLGFKEYFGEDEVFDLSRPSTMYPEPVEEEVKPLYSRFVKAGEMHAVPPSITGTYMPIPYKSDIEETQVSYGSKSDNKTSETLSESNDFVSCDNSDKSSDSETYASCDSSLKTKTNDFPPDVEDPNSTAGSPSFSCSENVKSPRIFCNKSGMNNRNVCKNNSVRVKKCFVCGSKLHLIKDCDFYNCVDSVPCKSKAAYVPAGSRNSSASVTAGGSDPAASRNRPAVNSAGRPNPTGRVGQAAHRARGPYFRPSSVYFNNMYWPNLYDPMYMNKGRWSTAVKTSAVLTSPSQVNGPECYGERNADYAEELAKLQRQEYEAKDAAARYGYQLAFNTAGGVSAGSTSAGSDPAVRVNPVGSFQPAVVRTCWSEAILLQLHLFCLQTFTFIPDQLSLWHRSLSSIIDEDLSATLTKIAPAVDVKPVPTKDQQHQSYRPNLHLSVCLLPFSGQKWILKNKRDAKESWLTGQQTKEGIDYDEVLVPDINVTPLTSHLNAAKKIFKYLKRQPKLALVVVDKFLGITVNFMAVEGSNLFVLLPSTEAEYVACMQAAVAHVVNTAAQFCCAQLFDLAARLSLHKSLRYLPGSLQSSQD
ncbi:putative ribonuclease H-like domain-containing protein [Tanacetum coccineum]